MSNEIIIKNKDGEINIINNVESITFSKSDKYGNNKKIELTPTDSINGGINFSFVLRSSGYFKEDHFLIRTSEMFPDNF